MKEISTKQFTADFKRRLLEKYAVEAKDASDYEIYQTLGSLVQAYNAKNRKDSLQFYIDHEMKQVYYFSIEFLPGKLLRSNLLNLGMLNTAQDAMKEMGIDFAKVTAQEPDMALGNGGLGRLASCFMDCLASCGFPGHGNGIRYKYGLFKQRFVDGYQVELPDVWLNRGNVWEVRLDSKAVDVRLGGKCYMVDDGHGRLQPVYEGGQILRAVPYDTTMVGFRNNVSNVMRLWSVEIPPTEEGKYVNGEQLRAVQDITSVLYPDDSNWEGQELRLKQEYFFVSAGIQSILRTQKDKYKTVEDLNKRIAIHINDTHPAMCVAEMMRILLDEEGLSWDKAWNMTVKIMSYTNHTIMAEALEKWPLRMIDNLLPRIAQIIQEIDRHFVAEYTPKVGPALVHRTRIVQNETVQMANLAIIGSHSTNGVAHLHTELLKKVVLKDFYQLFPERFNNKTNGITPRRWSQLANEPLSRVLDETIGEQWRYDIDDIKLLEAYYNDDRVLKKLQRAKAQNKQALARYIKETTGTVVNENSIFDVQIKRLHAYKRQLLNLLHILKMCFELKDDPQKKITPRTFIFGAKAAPSYHYAKSVIKCINEVGRMIDNDPDIGDKLKVVFLENYNVSLAERIVPAAEVGEQISLAGKEASGTSNMKLMMNGAVTLATLDGANVEIKEAVGDDNICIFGLTVDEVYDYYQNHEYRAVALYESDPVIRRVLDAFVDGTIPNIEQEGREIFDSLIKYNDEYFVLADFEAYVAAQTKLGNLYKDQKRWTQMSLMNIANSARFSADKTVTRYADDIWHVKPVSEVEK